MKFYIFGFNFTKLKSSRTSKTLITLTSVEDGVPMIGGDTWSVNELRRIKLALRPMEQFSVQISASHSVCSALLGVLGDIDASVRKQIHDSQLGSLHSSGLLGHFGGSDRTYYKTACRRRRIVCRSESWASLMPRYSRPP